LILEFSIATLSQQRIAQADKLQKKTRLKREKFNAFEFVKSAHFNAFKTRSRL